MAIQITTQPTTEPVPLELARLHLRVDGTDEDTLISALITAARQYCERFCRKTFPVTTYKLTLDQFPCGAHALEIPYPPLASVSGIVYTDTGGVSQTLSATYYTVDNQSEPGRLTPSWSRVWPIARGHTNDVAITFIAGSATCPQTVAQAMLLLIGHWYANREAVVTGTINSTVELAVESLLWSERIEV